MKKLKYEILFTILFMTIGIAAVTSNILISGSTELAANTDDFDVYFSDPTSEKSDTFVSINNSKSFTITTELKELNEEDKVNFKVTNASQNYDAEVSIDCTSESVYLKAISYLSSNIVPAREEIDGSVSIKLVRQSVAFKSNQKITCTINANAVERTTISNGIEYNEKLVMLKNYTARDAMGFGDYKQDIRTITFEDEINIPDNAIETWDFGVAENGNVMAYIVDNEDWGYDLYIQSDEQLYGNPDMSYWFRAFYSLEIINYIELLDTSKVTNMSWLFSYAESLESIDLSSWDTSDVTNMSYMFESCSSLTTIIGLENFDTSNVTNMVGMFAYSGITSLDLSNWNVSSWTSSRLLFAYAESLQTLDISNWDTSNVTDMNSMFEECYNLTTVIGLENLDTSNVTNMSWMFAYTNISNLDLGELETSKVTDMSGMLEGIGNTTLDLTDFDTSNVTNMVYMFANTNISNLDLSELETSKVTNMSYMFEGIKNTTLDLSNFDTSNVTNMSSMFASTNISNLDLSELETSNVTNMDSMFYYAGYNNPDFNIDLSKLDTSSVTDMSHMFYYTGYNSTKLNTSITIRNPNVTLYSNVFKNVANVSGTSFIVNYTSETESLVDKMIATKSEGANVVKGTLVE